MKKNVFPLLAAISLVTGVGCKSRITGNEGNLEFSYFTDDGISDFNKPVGVGAALEVDVGQAGRGQPVNVTAAQFADTAILEVTSIEAGKLIVEGRGDGNGLLEVTATLQNGSEVSDSVNMSAATPEVTILRHTCTERDDAAAFAGQRVFVEYELERANGQPVIGTGLYPFDATGEVVLVDEASTQQFMALDTGAAGSASITSRLDDTALDIAVVTPADIDAVEEPTAFVLEDIDVGDTNLFFVRPMSGGRTICQPDVEFNVVSDTPAICQVEPAERPNNAVGERKFEFGWFRVTGVTEGACDFTVTYPASGTTGSFSFPIEP